MDDHDKNETIIELTIREPNRTIKEKQFQIVIEKPKTFLTLIKIRIALSQRHSKMVVYQGLRLDLKISSKIPGEVDHPHPGLKIRSLQFQSPRDSEMDITSKTLLNMEL